MDKKEKMESVLPLTAVEQPEIVDVDLAVVERLQKGDMNALEELIQKYQKWVYTLAYRTVRNQADADDVTQETFIRVYRHIGQYRPQPGRPFAAWLYRITVNLSINAVKKRSREEVSGSGTTLTTGSGSYPDKEAQARELKSKIDAVLEGMSPEHRAIFTLCEIQGYSYKEIAEIMQCPIGTVMSRLYYAKKTLKEKLKSYL